MAKVDQTNEQPSGSNWEVYKDVFAPEQTRNIVRGWERAPVAAQAPRLQGHKIWKRPSNKLQRNGKDKDDGQAELEKEGAGSRKRLRMMGAKQNIGNAPWMEAQGDSENVGVASFLDKDITSGAETHVESMKENVAHDIASDALQFVPRKRTNINHVITPRKPLRQMTLNSQGQTQVASSASKSPAEKTRKRQSLRRSSRRVSLLEPAPSPRRISMQLPATTMFDNITDSDGVAQSQRGRLELVEEEGADVVEVHTSGAKVDEESTDKIHITDAPLNLSEDIIAEGLNEKSGVETETSIDFSKHETPEGPEPAIASPIPKKTPRSSRKTTSVSAEAEQEPIKLAKTPKSSKKTSAVGADVEGRTANSTRTPRSSKKNLSESVDAELEIDHPSKIPKPGKKTLRRSTRNTRASSVNIEATASALQETSPSQSLEPTISSHESNDIRRKTPEPQTAQTPLPISQATTPTTEPNPVATEEPILAPPQDQESTENQIETLVTDDLTERERLIQETVTDLLIEQARESLEAKDIVPQEEHLGADGQIERSEQLISNAEDNSEDTMRCEKHAERPLHEAFLLPPQEVDISISKSSSADSPLSEASEASEASESSLVNFSPENATRTFQFDLEVDVTSNQANVGQSASPFGIPDLAAIVDESTELVEDDVEISTPDPTTSELTETISTNAPLLSYDQDDTDMLRNFLTRVKANKAAKVEKSPKRKRSLPHSPLRLPLGESTETNLSSPPQEPVDEFDLGLTKVSPPAKRRKRGGVVLEDEDNTETRSIRRSGRTRLPVKTPPSAPSFIPVRRMGQDGDNTVTLKRSEEKELAALTRVNTRKNKGGALSAVEVLAKKAEEKDDPVLRQRLLKEVFDDKAQKGKKKGKSVVWAEELAQYQESERRKPDKVKEKEKKEKAEVVDDKKKNAVRVGIRSKIALGMAVNGTPAPKRKVKGRV